MITFKLSLSSTVAVLLTLSAFTLAQSEADTSGNVTENTIKNVDENTGYDAGFDFEALGVIGNAWRLGKIYYEESLFAAEALDNAIDAFLAEPNDETLQAARDAWTVSRTPYLRTEIFRFIIPQVADWEGKVNAWPLDEGLLDYTASPLPAEDNPIANANLVASAEFLVDGQMLDATVLTPIVLDALSEAGGGEEAEKNVTTGYHAVEFLLWGQDLNGTLPGAGNRPWTDFALDAETCTNGNCERRRALLKLVSEQLGQ